MGAERLPSFFITVRGLTVHYKCGGVGEPLLLLHGAGSDWREWEQNIPALTNLFRVYAPDLPGYGQTPYPDHPVPLSWYGPFLADFLAAVGLERTHVAGHSLGGLAAILLSLTCPAYVNRMVLVDSAGIEPMCASGRLRLSLLKAAGRVAGRKTPVYAPEPDGAWLVNDRLHGLACPVLLVWGSRDPYFPLSSAFSAQKLIPCSTLHVFEGCTHAPQRERRERFNSLMCDFLHGPLPGDYADILRHHFPASFPTA